MERRVLVSRLERRLSDGKLMSPRASKVCSFEQCFQAVRDGGSRCEAHRRKPWDGPRTESSRVTGTRRFTELRRQVLARDGGMCRIMGPTCTRIATEVDHIVEVSAGGAPYDPKNLQSVCGPCHHAKPASPTRVAPPRPIRGRRRRAFDGSAVPKAIWTNPPEA